MVINENGARNLGAGIIIQMLKDYFKKGTSKDTAQDVDKYCDKKTIKKQLESEWLYQLTDGLNLTVLNALNNNEKFVEANMKHVNIQ